MSPINEKEIALFGLKRSGNHAVIHWLMDAIGPGSFHLNDVTTKDPYDSCREINIRGAKSFKKATTRKTLQSLTARWRTTEYSKNSTNVDWQGIHHFKPKSCLVISYENCPFDSDIYQRFCEHHDQMVGHSRERYRIVLLRDAFNLFASQFRAQFLSPEEIDRGVDIYKQYAELFLDPDRQRQEKIICVSYNDWFQYNNYRIELAQKFGLSVNGKPFRKVPSIGGGSSFEGRAMHQKAHKMNVLERWKLVAHEPEYRRIFQDRYLTELSNEIFGQIAPSLKPESIFV